MRSSGFIGSGGVIFTSSDGIVLYEISSYQKFALNDFKIVVGDDICTSMPTQSPTALPPPIFLPGPMATINVTLTTDAFPNETLISYFSFCTGENVVHQPDHWETQYNFSFTLKNGEYEIAISDVGTDGTHKLNSDHAGNKFYF